MIAQIQVSQVFSEIRDGLDGLSIAQIFTIQGVLNGLVYSAGRSDGVIYRENGKLRFKFNLIADFFRGDRTVVTPVKFLSEYLKKYWAGRAYHSRDAVYKIRDLICQKFKVFTLEDRSEVWRDPNNRHRSPNPCGDFNMLRALLLARACEDILLTRLELSAEQLIAETAGNGHYEFERIEEQSLPQHKAYTLAAIGKAAGIWRESDVPHPGIVGAIELECLRIKAEQQFWDVEDDRTPEEILEQEFVAVTETEIVISGDMAVVTERVVDAVPLIVLVRRSMLVGVDDGEAAARIGRRDGGITVPLWARIFSERAIAWWDDRICNCGWLQDMAPDWVLDAIVPF